MPRSTEEIVEELNDRLGDNTRLHGHPTLTVTWHEFYDFCDAARFKKARLTEIQDNALSRYGLIVGYGNSAVLIGHDRNFSPWKTAKKN